MTNRLKLETSSYLRSAAEQPVQWYPWGKEAFDQALLENKPILLDIGAIWCHWCHVIDRESYENPAIAAIINEQYIAIKVDRDERPDIDVRYQQSVQAISGQGGWPLTGFLTPSGDLFYGGTYFPPEDTQGHPGFPTVLKQVAEIYRTRKEQVIRDALQIKTAILESVSAPVPSGEIDPEVLTRITDAITRNFDAEQGGFNGSPKFFHPSALLFAMDRYLVTKDELLKQYITVTLEKMAKGGVYDQLAGGFHRYSVDRYWMVPHFEKLLNDNAELLKVYIRAYKITGHELFKDVASGIIQYVKSVLSNQATGGFYASQDADISLEDDGDYFTWTLAESKAVLSTEEFEVMQWYYGIYAQGEMHAAPERNVLYIEQEPERIASQLKRPVQRVIEIIQDSKLKMLSARQQRATPFVDPTIYSHWNGMMISAFLDAWKYLGDRTSGEYALKTLDFLVQNAFSESQGMAHAYREGTRKHIGLLEDQVWVALALSDAYEITGEASRLKQAVQLTDLILREYQDLPHGGFFDIQGNPDMLLALTKGYKSIYDSPGSSGNGMVIQLLLKMHAITDDVKYLYAAETALKLLVETVKSSGIFGASLGTALEYYLQGVRHITLIGELDDSSMDGWSRSIYQNYHPAVWLRRANLPAVPVIPGGRSDPGIIHRDEIPVAVLCCQQHCYPPVNDPVQLMGYLNTLE